MSKQLQWAIGGLALLIVGFVAFQIYLHINMKRFIEELADPEPNTETETEQPTEQVQVPEVDNTNPTAEETITETTPVTKNTETTHAQTETPVQNSETADVLVSPFGFGPFPEIPEDFPYRERKTWPMKSREGELLRRVLIKLWTEGEKNFIGGSTDKGKVYPHYFDTVYIGIEETKTEGSITRVTHIKSGPFVHYSLDEFGNPPPHIRILDLETSGINPYQYLDLPYQKGK